MAGLGGARSVLVPMVVLAALAVEGCSGSEEGGSHPSASSSSEETMIAVQAPPDSAPDATVNGITIPPLSSIWYSDSSSSFHTARPTIEPNEVIAIPTSGPVRITVNSPVIPAQVFVREFTGYDAEGIPSGERPTVGCAIEGQTCALESNGDSVTAAVELDSATVFVTVEVYYHINSLDAEYPYDIVTYGFRV